MPKRSSSAIAAPSVLNAALEYAERGWSVIPVHYVAAGRCSCGETGCPRPGKHPIASLTPHGLSDATTDKAVIQQWWTRWPDANLAHLCGPESGFFVVDLDTADARSEFEKHSALPKTRIVKTGRGWHVFFRYPSGTLIKNSSSKIGAGIDIKSERGYVLAPPSLHASGSRYELLDDSPLAYPPSWLLTKLSEAPAAKPKSANTNSEIPEGGRNTKLASVAGAMQRLGMPQDALVDALLAYNEEHCDPPLSEKEVRAIVRSITRYEPEPPRDIQDDDLLIGQDSIANLVTKADHVIAEMPEERVFKTPQSRRIVHAVQNQTPVKGIIRDPQASIIVEADSTYLRDVLSRSGKVFRLTAKKELIPADPPRDITDTLIARVRTSPNRVSLRPLWMLSNTPKLDGESLRILCDPGYYDGILIDAPEGKFSDPEPNERLCVDQCRQLWEQHFDPCFSKYPFPKEEYQSVVKSSALSVVLRNLLPAVPLNLITSPAQGSGKSILVEAVSTLTTGRRPAVATYKGVEEFGKHLTVLLGNGDPVISVDNIIMTVNHSDLASALTTKGAFRYRVLGKSEERVIENNSVMFLNGNNLQVATDMTRRCLLVRIEPDCERPEQRSFAFNPVTLGQQLHPRAVMSLLRIARAHARAGFPGLAMLSHPMGGFEEYDQWVRATLVWCGFADPQVTQDEIRDNDPERRGNVELLYAIAQSPIGPDPFLIRDMPEKFKNVPSELETVRQITGHKDGEEFNQKKVSHYFSHHLLNRPLEQFRLVKTGRMLGGKTEWRLEMKQGVKRAEEEAM